MMVGISIVIPCYNAEAYIIRCLESIYANCYSNFEIIIINDKSDDRTEEIINMYINKNNRKNIVLLNSEVNEGAGRARNKGIKRAKKEYITFVDADDMVSMDFLNTINYYAEKKKCDCLIFNAIIKKGKKEKTFDMFYGGKITAGRIELKRAIVFTKGCTFGKAYKTSIIKKNRIQYAGLKRNEDLVFTKIALSYCKRVYFTDKRIYYYIDNVNSLMHNVQLLNKDNAFSAYRMIENSLKGRGFEEELHSIYLIEVIYSTTMTTIKQNNDIIENYKKVTNNYIFKDSYIRFYHLKYKVLIMAFRLKLFCLVRKLVNYRWKGIG